MKRDTAKGIGYVIIAIIILVPVFYFIFGPMIESGAFWIYTFGFIVFAVAVELVDHGKDLVRNRNKEDNNFGQ
jgi:hypothetical protein